MSNVVTELALEELINQSFPKSRDTLSLIVLGNYSSGALGIRYDGVHTYSGIFDGDIRFSRLPKDKKGEAYVLFLKGGGVSIAIMRKFISLQRLRPR